MIIKNYLKTFRFGSRKLNPFHQRQRSAGVSFTAIAASQKVSEGTLRRRLKGDIDNIHQFIG